MPYLPLSRFEDDNETLELFGVLHVLRAHSSGPEFEQVTIEAWSPGVMSGMSATCALSIEDRRRLAEFLLRGLA